MRPGVEDCWSAGVGGECCGELAALSFAPPPTETESAAWLGVEPDEEAEAAMVAEAEEVVAEAEGEPCIEARERDERDEDEADGPASAAPAAAPDPLAPAACDLAADAPLRVPTGPAPMNRSIWLPSCRKKCSNSSRCLEAEQMHTASQTSD